MVERGIDGTPRRGGNPAGNGRRRSNGGAGDTDAASRNDGDGTGRRPGRSTPLAEMPPLAAGSGQRAATGPVAGLGPDGIDLAGRSAELMRAIRRITRAVDVQSKRVTRASGLTIPQIVILQSLHERGALSTGGLAAEISLSAPTVTTVLDRLEGRGLVRRTRKPEDRRIVLTELTDRGREVLAQAPPLLHGGFLAAFAGMGNDDQVALVAALRNLADLMDRDPLHGGLLTEEADPVD